MLNKLIFSFALMLAGTASALPDLSIHQSVYSVQVAKNPVSTPGRSAQVEALLHNKLLNDHMSPVVGAEQPVLKIVTFVNYDCMYCKQLERSLEKLLKAYPQVAVTYKLFSYGTEASTAATRMALTIWPEQPEKFHAFYQALMAYSGVADDARIHSALRIAGVRLNKFSPGTYHNTDLNRELLRRL